jgi:hypothetical protein
VNVLPELIKGRYVMLQDPAQLKVHVGEKTPFPVRISNRPLVDFVLFAVNPLPATPSKRHEKLKVGQPTGNGMLEASQIGIDLNDFLPFHTAPIDLTAISYSPGSKMKQLIALPIFRIEVQIFHDGLYQL